MKINIKYYKELLLEYKTTFIVAFLFVLLLGIMKIIFTPNLYVSHSSLEIMQYNEGYTSLLDTLNQTKRLIRTPDDEAQIIKSSNFLIHAIKKLNLTTQYFIKKSLTYKAVDAKDMPFKVNITRNNDHTNILIKIHALNAKSADVTIYVKDAMIHLAHKLDTPLSWATTIYHRKVNYGTNIKLSNFNIVILKKVKSKLHNKIYYVTTSSIASVLFQIERHLVVRPITKKSNIIGITYWGTTPNRAKSLVSELLFLFNKQTLKVSTEQIKDAIAVISSQLEKAKKRLKISAKSVEAYQSKYLLLNVNDQFKNIEQTITQLRAQNASIQVNMKIYETLVEKIMEHQKLTNLLVNDKNIMLLVTKKDVAVLKEQELLTRYTPSDPKVKAIHKKIESLRQRIKGKIINKLANFKAEVSAIDKLILNLNTKIASLPKYAAHLVQLKQAYNTDLNIYKNLLKNKLQMTTNVAKAQVNNLVIDPPSESKFPIYPKRVLWAVITIILALIVAFIMVLVKNILNQKITKPRDIVRISKYPLFGTVPFVKSKDYNKLFILDGQDIIIESFRKIRTNLEYVGNRKTDNKTILVTSSISNEGKTTFAANLAMAVAMLNKKVIIVSFDLRIPQLHMKFNLENTTGVSEILAGKAILKDVVQSYSTVQQGVKDLDVITSGTVPPNPAELINSSRLEDLMRELRENYDIIIMDAPPVMTVSETKTLVKESDVTLFVLKAGKSRIDNLEYLSSFSDEFKDTSFGLILTSVQEKYLDLPEYDKNYAMFVKSSKDSRKI